MATVAMPHLALVQPPYVSDLEVASYVPLVMAALLAAKRGSLADLEQTTRARRWLRTLVHKAAGFNQQASSNDQQRARLLAEGAIEAMRRG